jgi:hypothetical protein
VRASGKSEARNPKPEKNWENCTVTRLHEVMSQSSVISHQAQYVALRRDGIWQIPFHA